MNAIEVFSELDRLGVSLTLDAESLAIEPASRVPQEVKESIRLNKITIRAILQLREMPFPQGYLGLPETVVVATEAYNDWWGTTDPIARKIRVCSWTLDHLCNDGQADTGLYIQVKDEKHRLLHEGGYAKSECGMCDFQPWDDLNA